MHSRENETPRREPPVIRPADAEEMDAFKHVAVRSLMVVPEAVEAIRPEWTLCAFENGRLSTSYAWWPLKMRFNGEMLPAAGVTFVGTSPACRRKGYLRAVISRHFERMHEKREQPVAALHASRASIYQRYGYAVVSWQNSYCFEPRHIVFGEKPAAPRGRLYEPGEGPAMEILKDIYRQFCADRTGYIHRGKATWEMGAMAPAPKNGSLFAIVYEEDDTPLGYVIYTARPGKSIEKRLTHQIEIRDFAWLTPHACRSLWEHMAGMDLAGEIRWMRVPPDDPLPHLIREPADLNIRTRDGVLARIVDVAGALGGRRYPAEGRICFELDDELCPWNRGCWEMETFTDPDAENPAGTLICHGEARPANGSPDVTLPADTLAMLVFGQIDATRAADIGRLTVHKPDRLAVWDRLLRTRHKPFCADFF